MDSLEIITKLGNPSFRKNEYFLYYSKERVLLLKIESGKVSFLKFVRINSTEIKEEELLNLIKN